MELWIGTLKEAGPMLWTVLFAALFICVASLFAAVIKLWLKLMIIIIMLVMVLYFLREAGLV
jgi:hypothetical protein